MILNTIFDFGIWLFELIAESFPNMQPAMYNVANSFWELGSFGVWVIGADYWQAFIGTVSGWLTCKMIWGVVLFVYRLLPLT